MWCSCVASLPSVGSDFVFEMNREKALAAALDIAIPLVRRAEDKVTESGRIALQLHAPSLVARGRALYRLCRHGLVVAVTMMSKPVPSSVSALLRYVENARIAYRDLVGDAVAGESPFSDPFLLSALFALPDYN